MVRRSAWVIVSAALGTAGCGETAPAAPTPVAESPRLVPLSAVAVPRPLGGDIVDEAAAVRLGKALFWDVQAGSDGRTACATCHFHAGADSRRRNTIHPGPNGAFEDVPGPGAPFAGATLRGDDAVGSQGVVRALLTKLDGVQDPSLLVVKRSGEVTLKLSGFVDRETVAQAASNATS